MANICGLYIGAESLSLLALKPVKKGWAVEAGGVELHGAGEAGDLAPAIKNLSKALKVTSGEIVVSLPKQQAILRNVVLPSTEREELAQMARFEAERHIPFHAERHSTGFHVMRSMGVEGSEVILGAADGPVIQRALSGATSNGFSLRSINLSSVCLVNSLLFEKREWIKGKTVAVMCLGLDSIDLVFLTDGRLIFARSAALDLRGVLEIWSGYSSSNSEGPRPDMNRLATAARMIDVNNLDGHYGQTGAASTRENAALVRGWIDRAMQELRRTYDFARREMKCPPIEALVITGEGAMLQNLDQYFYVNLNMEIQTLNPVASLPGAQKHKFPFNGLEYVIPFGAAVSAGMPDAFQIDLTPAEHYKKLSNRRMMRQLITTAILLVITIGLGTVAWMRYTDISRRRQAAYDDVNKRMQPRVSELKEMKVKLDIIKDFLEDKGSALNVLVTIAKSPRVPDKVNLRRINYEKNDSIELEGEARQNPDLNAFIQDLMNSHMFQDVSQQGAANLLPSAVRGVMIYNFKISATLAAEEEKSNKGGEQK